MAEYSGKYGKLPEGLTEADVDAALASPDWARIPGSREFVASQFFGLPPGYQINPAGWEAFLARAPYSQNIEDRRESLLRRWPYHLLSGFGPAY